MLSGVNSGQEPLAEKTEKPQLSVHIIDWELKPTEFYTGVNIVRRLPIQDLCQKKHAVVGEWTEKAQWRKELPEWEIEQILFFFISHQSNNYKCKCDQQAQNKDPKTKICLHFKHI